MVNDYFIPRNFELGFKVGLGNVTGHRNLVKEEMVESGFELVPKFSNGHLLNYLAKFQTQLKLKMA